ncbi:MAG: SH3 domain-containing protein, partial [Silvanigrellales bacterium]|nr:SH3 domain-containing protein [Silvanigrellales bacterium]
IFHRSAQIWRNAKKSHFPNQAARGLWEQITETGLHQFNNFLKSKNSGLRADLVPQLRLVANPFCIGQFHDAALHLIYSIAPSKDVFDKVTQSAGVFVSQAKGGKGKEAALALEEHAKVLASKEYQDFRRGFIQEIFPLVSVRRSLGDAAYADLNTKILPFLSGEPPLFLNTSMMDGMDSASGSQPRAASPGFGAPTSAGRLALGTILKKHAVQSKLAGIAMFAVTRPGIWIFAATNSAGEPKLLQSVGFKVTGDSVELLPLHNQGFYGLGGGTPELRDVTSKAVENLELLQEYDVYTDVDSKSDMGVYFDKQQKEFNAKIPTLLNVEKTTGTTSTCASCHMMSEMRKMPNGTFSSAGMEPESNLHVSTFMGKGPLLSARMVSEVVHESASMNEEMRQLGITFVASAASLAPVAAPAQASAPAVASVFCRVNSPVDGFMNVRAAPNSAGAEIGKAQHGTGFNKIGQSGRWIKVEIRLGGTLQGNPGSPFKDAYIFEDGVKC